MTEVSREMILAQEGDFTWFYGMDWFVETPLGNFHWKNPDYGSKENTLTMFGGTYHDFCKHLNMEFGRSKGPGLVSAWVGQDVKIILPPFQQAAA